MSENKEYSQKIEDLYNFDIQYIPQSIINAYTEAKENE